MDKIVLPEFGAHLGPYARSYKFNELLAAPFPQAKTTEAILNIAANVEEQGYLIVVVEQYPVRLRAPKVGEKGIVVAETTAQPAGEKPKRFYYSADNAATGTVNSKLWFCRSDYHFLYSFKALKEEWRKRKEDMQTQKLIRAGLTVPFDKKMP